MKRWAIIAGVVLVVVLVSSWWFKRSSNNKLEYRTVEIAKGTITQVVRTTGKISPIVDVEVGAQVSGRIIKLYADFNSKVEEGQILAQIDPVPYKEKLQQDKANLKKAQAEVEQLEAKLKLADLELERDKELAEKGMLTQSELDNALANRKVLQAQLKAARAALEQASASLRLSRTNLEYTTIRSPTSGIVVSRNVSEGQTIVTNLSAQTLFVIANDLSQVQVEAAVPEADIGKIKEGMEAVFTVDSYPDVEFKGKVTQVRIAASTVQNVVTYPVIITADNPDGKLFPGMTANVAIEVAFKENVLYVPNSALRFKPTDTVTSRNSKSKEGQNGNEKSSALSHKVWVKDGKTIKPITVAIGISDGYFTEIVGGQVTEGQEVITGILVEGTEKTDGKVNPFMPRFPGRGRR